MSLTKHQTQASPTTTALLLADPNGSRAAITIQNVGAVDCWLGPDSTVAAGSGIKLAAGAVLSENAPACSNDSWWAVTASGTADLRIVEVF